MMILILFIIDRKGKGKELKVPYYASAAALCDDYVTYMILFPIEILPVKINYSYFWLHRVTY